MTHFSLLHNKGKYFRNSFVIVFLVFFLIVGTLLVYFLIGNQKSNKRQIFNFENAELEKTSVNVENALDEVATMCNYLSTINLDNSYFISEDANYANYLIATNQINSYLSLFNQINEISIYSPTGSIYRSQVSQKDEINFEQDGINAGKIKNVSVFVIPNRDAYNSLFFNLFNKNISHAENKVSISVNNIALGKEILSYKKDRKEYLLDSDGNVISSYDMSKIGKTINEIYSIDNFKVSSGQSEIKSGKNVYISSVMPISGTNLFSVSFTDINYYSQYFNSNLISNILVCLIILIITIGVCIILLQYFYRPIKNMLNQIGQYQKINIEKNINEVEYISQKFDRLYQKNIVLDKAAEKAISDLKLWNVAALQTQICPHFLYNTLDSINWLAFKYLGIDNGISVAAQDIAYIMRKSLDTNRMLSDINEEIDITKKYLEIIDIRYEHKFNIEWQIDDDALACVIPRLCIQPLIENAVTHAFSGDSVNNKIIISVNVVADNIVITVSDNGLGISEENLDSIRNNIRINSLTGSKNIGLRNINQRCKIIFGESYGITISSKLGSGSLFCLTIPRDMLDKLLV